MAGQVILRLLFLARLFERMEQSGRANACEWFMRRLQEANGGTHRCFS
jgi:hypothetical protein